MFPLPQTTPALPVVMQRSRVLMMFGVVAGFISLSVGLEIRPNHWMVDGLVPAEWLLDPLGVFLMVYCTGRVFRPARLTLTAAGLEFRHLLWTRREPWENVLAVGLRTWQFRRTTQTGVEIRFKTGASLQINGEWPKSPYAMVAMIEDAQRNRPVPRPSDLRVPIPTRHDPQKSGGLNEADHRRDRRVGGFGRRGVVG
jgi:hypothetical protein